MSITNGYCTLAEFKAYLDTTSSNTADDAVIEDIIESTSRRIDGEVGFVFYQQASTVKYYNAEDSYCLKTDYFYNTTGLTIQTDLDGDGVYENTWDSEDYNVTPYTPQPGWPYSGIETAIQGSSTFSRARRGNKITANFGWSAVPDDIKILCIRESVSEYRKRYGQNMNTTSTVTAAGVVLTPIGWSDDAVKVFRKYKKYT